MHNKIMNKPANVALIESMITMGNLGKNIRIVGETKEGISLEKSIMVNVHSHYLNVNFCEIIFN